jgi:hypothetical protein
MIVTEYRKCNSDIKQNNKREDYTMEATQNEEKFFTEGSQGITLAHIAEQWVKRLALGEIRYDPRKVESRGVTAPKGNPGRFKVILNGNRKNRLEKKAA